MQKKNIYVTIEPCESTPIWFSSVLQGIKEACYQKRIALNVITIDEKLCHLAESSVVVVISSNIDWTTHTIRELKKANLIPLLIGSDPSRFGNSISGVFLNRYQLIEQYIKYLITCGKFSIALLGLNPRSDNDLTKMNSFLRTGIAMDIALDHSDIYWLEDDFTAPIEKCLNSEKHYDAVICSNDYCAIALMAEARKRGISIPKDMYVVAMGHTLLGELCTPSLTTTSDDDFHEMGRQGFLIAETLASTPKLSRVSIAVDNTILPRESTECIPVTISEDELGPISVPSIATGPVSKEIRNLETLFQQSDEKDLEILTMMMEGKTNEQIEDLSFLAHSSLYYRQKKMFQVTKTNNKTELINLIQHYLPDYPVHKPDPS